MNQELETVEIKRFDPKIQASLLLKLEKVFSVHNAITETRAVEQEPRIILDPANVCGIVGKTEEAKRVLAAFYPGDDRNTKVPELVYETVNETVLSKYSIDYLGKLLPIFEVFRSTGKKQGLAVTIQTKRDYPLTLENEHFKVILAPRVESD